MKKLEFTKEELGKITHDLNLDIIEYKNIKTEADIDDAVKNYLKKLYNEDNIITKKTGITEIDKNIPSYNGGGANGEPDVMIFNYFNNNEIDVIIENKMPNNPDDEIEQAKTYARVGNTVNQPIRVIIGNRLNKTMDIKVKVGNEYKSLFINGEKICNFFGKSILKMIYENPDENEFTIIEKNDNTMTQKEFHNIINNLKVLYRQIPEIQNNDDISINFTIAFIGLKMVMEKLGRKWETIKTIKDITDNLNDIIGKKPSDLKIKEKYSDIFIIKNKEENEVFNFLSICDAIGEREYNENKNDVNSILMKIHSELNKISNDNSHIDLFGEVYEMLASKKTKSMLGEFFTRRHIIQAIVRMFFTSKEIEEIGEGKRTIADPACGTGGFLTESFKYIKDYCLKKGKTHEEISEIANKVIIGYDINANNIGRSRINMILAGDGFSVIERYNTLNTNYCIRDKNKGNEIIEEGIEKNIDYILTNVPYGKGDYSVSKNSEEKLSKNTDKNTDKNNNEKDDFFSNNTNKRLELNFLLKIIEMLKNGGRAAIIVPEGLLEAPSLSKFREYFLKKCKIETVISLPKFAFAPYTKWKTYVVFFEKRTEMLEKIEDVKDEEIWAYIVDNDGYANSDKRFPTNLKNKNGEWLHDELQRYIDKTGKEQLSKIEKVYKNKLDDEEKVYYNEWNEKIEGKKYGKISLKKILEKSKVDYKKIATKTLNAKLSDEANNKQKLDDELHNLLISNCSFKKGKYIIKKEDYLENNELKEEFIEIFEKLNINYDNEEEKFYNTTEEIITYELPLIPEKYFRKKEIKKITIEDLEKTIKDLEIDFKNIMECFKNED